MAIVGVLRCKISCGERKVCIYWFFRPPQRKVRKTGSEGGCEKGATTQGKRKRVSNRKAKLRPRTKSSTRGNLQRATVWKGRPGP